MRLLSKRWVIKKYILMAKPKQQWFNNQLLQTKTKCLSFLLNLLATCSYLKLYYVQVKHRYNSYKLKLLHNIAAH